MAKSTAAAQETLAYCTSCKMDLNHVVVAMKGDRIAKVQCLTCKKEHAFKAPKGATEPGKAKAKSKSKKKDAAAESQSHPVEVEWEKLMLAHADSPFKNYDMKAIYGLGDKLKHPTFGDGIVGKLIYPNKLEVIFKTDIKILISGGHPS